MYYSKNENFRWTNLVLLFFMFMYFPIPETEQTNYRNEYNMGTNNQKG